VLQLIDGWTSLRIHVGIAWDVLLYRSVIGVICVHVHTVLTVRLGHREVVGEGGFVDDHLGLLHGAFLHVQMHQLLLDARSDPNWLRLGLIFVLLLLATGSSRI